MGDKDKSTSDGKEKYTKQDAAKDTDAGGKETARAWHQARDDAEKSGELPERAANKAKEKE